MLSKFVEFFRSEEDQDPSFLRLNRNILVLFLIADIALLFLLGGILGEEANFFSFTIVCIVFIIEAFALWQVLRGNPFFAKILLPLILTFGATISIIDQGGIQSVGILVYAISMIISAILLGRIYAKLVVPLIIVNFALVTYLDLSGKILIVESTLTTAFLAFVFLITIGIMTNMLITRLSEKVEKAQISEQLEKQKNSELNELQISLEERVSQRTAELQEANRVNERRARQFQAVAEVTKIISSIQNLETLLPKITEIISELFGIYHTGIFLFDENREYAVLRAANSTGGKKMMEIGHKLAVGQIGIVGFVSATGQARIALDVGADAVFFNNPHLPNTRSEMALPLRYSNQIVGVLDVQSLESNAFSQDDVNVLITLADQVAVAINNAITIENAQKSLAEAQTAIRKSTVDAWQVMRPKSLHYGLSLTENSLKQLEKPLDESYVREAISKGETVSDNTTNLAIPIRLRGQVVGVVNLNTKNRFELNEDSVDIAESIAERLSLALENATLLQAAQNRADFERVTTDITSRISSSTRFETILQTAAQELSRALGGSDVLVQIEPVALEMSAGNE